MLPAVGSPGGWRIALCEKIGLKSKKQNFTDVVSTSYVSGCNCDEESVQGRLMKARRESTGLCGEAVSEDFLPRIDPSQACDDAERA